MLQRAASFSVLSLLVGCASILDEDGALAVVPYQVGNDGQIIVETRVNNEGPFRFTVDTGASITVILDKTRRTAGLKPLPGSEISIQGIISAGRFPLVTAESLRVGDENWTNARMASLPGDTLAVGDVDGVLGLDFLRRYSVGISDGDGALRLYPPELTRERSYRGWTSIPLSGFQIPDSKASAYTIDLVIGPETIPALFDLGATTNVMNWRAARALRIRPLRPKQESSIAGALQTTPVLAEINFELVKTEGIYWRNRRFLVGDFPVFEVLDLTGRPMAIVGTDLFGRRDLIIDFARSRLLVKVPD
jgi:predicted aspartyl protease